MKNVRNTLLGLYFNLLTVIIYLLFIENLAHNVGKWVKWVVVIIFIASSVLNIIFAALNIVQSFKLVKNDDFFLIQKNMKVLKFGVIPYFIINFILYILLFLLFFAASRGFILLTPIPLLFLIPIFFLYITAIVSSTYGIGFLFILYKAKRIKKGKLILHIILQLCFVLDVIDTIILITQYKTNKIMV